MASLPAPDVSPATREDTHEGFAPIDTEEWKECLPQ
jgi:hypothetical protein